MFSVTAQQRYYFSSASFSFGPYSVARTDTFFGCKMLRKLSFSLDSQSIAVKLTRQNHRKKVGWRGKLHVNSHFTAIYWLSRKRIVLEIFYKYAQVISSILSYLFIWKWSAKILGMHFLSSSIRSSTVRDQERCRAPLVIEISSNKTRRVRSRDKTRPNLRHQFSF